MFRWSDHRGNIVSAWNKGTDPILDTGAACFAAAAELDVLEKKALIKSLPFGESAFSKFVSIGATKRLYDAAVRDRLPPKFTVIYMLSQLSEQEFTALSEEPLFSRQLKRSQLETWKKERLDPTIARPKLPSLPNTVYAAVCPASSLAAIDEQGFRQRLSALAQEFDMKVLYPSTAYRSPRDLALDYMRTEAVKVVDHVLKQRKRRLQNYGGKAPAFLKRNPGFSLGDINIGPHADLDRIKSILKKVGYEATFDQLRVAAYTAYALDAGDLQIETAAVVEEEVLA